MMSNENSYGTLNLRAASKLWLRTEAHALPLAFTDSLPGLEADAVRP